MSDSNHNYFHTIYILVGSNIQPEKNIYQALELLHDRMKILKVSQIWETMAVGSTGPNFLNCAVLINSDQDEETIKVEILSKIEDQLGRIRTEDKNAPRTIDIDPVISDGIILDKRVFDEPFLALPLNDLLPDLIDPSTGITLGDKVGLIRDHSFYRNRSDVELPPLM